MKALSFSFLLIILSSYHCWVTLAHENFIQCLSLHSENSTSISQIVYTQNNSSFSSILEFSLQNLRFSTPTTQKPKVIITPFLVSQVQAAIKCSQKYGLQIRVRSGGHDYEGLSYASNIPFIIIDMLNFSEISVDAEEKISWVQSGATLGQLYYRIAEKSKTLAFPAGTGPTVGVGGHISGGGYGFLLRKYGVAADHVVDAHLIDVKGRFLNRKSMGEDLFWAIRGGGGANFGVIIAWKINLVTVPSTVTVFKVKRTLEQNATKILHKWQHVAHMFHEDLFISPVLKRVNSRMVALFSSLFLGGVDRLLPLVHESFPELGLTREDCKEMSWIESIIYLDRFPKKESAKLDLLLDRSSSKSFFKGKLDYVKEPISEEALEGMYDIFYDQEEGKNAVILFFPQGGKVTDVSESEIPYPHRAGNIYSIIYYAEWVEGGVEDSERHVNLVRKLYNYMTPYVPKNPRVATLNARDLDIGTNNNEGCTSIDEASIWGNKYFKDNFKRLVQVKTMVDPDNFFRNEQSIPPAFNLADDKRLLDTIDCEEVQSIPPAFNLADDKRLLDTIDCEEVQSFPVNINLHNV